MRVSALSILSTFHAGSPQHAGMTGGEMQVLTRIGFGREALKMLSE